MPLADYHEGAFSLHACFTFFDSDNNPVAPTQETVEQWKQSWGYASALLHKATHGQMRIGTIRVGYADCPHADAYMCQDHGDSKTPYVSKDRSYIHLADDARTHPFVIIHEFGHYGLGIEDEYRGGSDYVQDRTCTGDPRTHACIMEFSRDEGDKILDFRTGKLREGQVFEFCSPADHNLATKKKSSLPPDNAQEELHHQSCWETIKKNYPRGAFGELRIPKTPFPEAGIAAPEPIKWVDVTCPDGCK